MLPLISSIRGSFSFVCKHSLAVKHRHYLRELLNSPNIGIKYHPKTTKVGKAKLSCLLAAHHIFASAITCQQNPMMMIRRVHRHEGPVYTVAELVSVSDPWFATH